jgi:hypothetical protein
MYQDGRVDVSGFAVGPLSNETLKIDPIGSSIPNRGFVRDDIEVSIHGLPD